MSNNEKIYKVYVVKLNRPRSKDSAIINFTYAGRGSYEDCKDKIISLRSYSDYIDAGIMDSDQKIVDNFLFEYDISPEIIAKLTYPIMMD